MEPKSNAQKFLEELELLCKKYKVRIEGFDSYDSDESYVGTDHYFTGPGIFEHIDEELI